MCSCKPLGVQRISGGRVYQFPIHSRARILSFLIGRGSPGFQRNRVRCSIDERPIMSHHSQGHGKCARTSRCVTEVSNTKTLPQHHQEVEEEEEEEEVVEAEEVAEEGSGAVASVAELEDSTPDDRLLSLNMNLSVSTRKCDILEICSCKRSCCRRPFS